MLHVWMADYWYGINCIYSISRLFYLFIKVTNLQGNGNVPSVSEQPGFKQNRRDTVPNILFTSSPLLCSTSFLFWALSFRNKNTQTTQKSIHAWTFIRNRQHFWNSPFGQFVSRSCLWRPKHQHYSVTHRIFYSVLSVITLIHQSEDCVKKIFAGKRYLCPWRCLFLI